MLTLATATDLSIILLSVPMCLMGLVAGAVLFGAVYAMHRARPAVPPRLHAARWAVRRTRDQIDRVTGAVTRPIFAAHVRAARWRAIGRAVTRRNRKMGQEKG